MVVLGRPSVPILRHALRNATMPNLMIRIDMGKQKTEEIEAAPQPPRRRGRPSLGDEAMSSSQRQKQYRARLKKAMYETDVLEMTRVTVMQQLTSAVISLEDDGYELADGARSVAERMIGEVVARYGLDLARVRKHAKASAERRAARL